MAITNVILNNVVRPVVYGRTVHIHPAVVLIALPAGATVAGVVGLFVAVPVVAFITAVAGALIAVIEPERTDTSLDTGLVPGWLDRVAQWSWRLLVGAALMVFVIAVVTQLPLVVVPVVLAIVLAATFLPILNVLMQRGWGRNRAALAITAGAFLIITVVLAATTFVLVEQLQPIAAQASAGASKIASAAPAALGGVESATTEATGTLLIATTSVVAGTASFVVIVVLATLLTFYFLRDGSRVWAALMTRLAPWRRTDVDAAGTRAAGVLGGYMIGTGAISIFGAATQFLIMVVLGLPLALPLAVLSFFGGFIPYIGSFITTGIAFLVTVAVGSPQDIAIMGIFTIVFNIVQGNVVAPIVYGKAVNLHPAIVLMAIPAGAALAGIIGMFLVVPFVGVVAATWRTVLRVFGDEPHVADALAPPSELASPAIDPVT